MTDTKLEEVLLVGTRMSNFCHAFSRSGTLTDEDRKGLRRMQVDWDYSLDELRKADRTKENLSG